MVVVYHASFYARTDLAGTDFVAGLTYKLISYMWIGVPIFFAISGYCITASSDSARRKPRAVQQYFWRRFRRIFPPYWILLTISIVVVAFMSIAGWPAMFSDANHPIPHPATLSLSQWTGNIALMEQWRFHLFGDGSLNFLGPAWSLCYEEQFYAVCGLIIFLMPRRFFQGAACVTLLVVSLTFIHVFIKFPTSGFFFDGRWLLFAAGILAYYRLNYACQRYQRLIDIFLCISIVLSILLYVKSPAKNQGFAIELIVASSFALTISLIHKWDERIAASKLLRPITFCGVMCYSLYLVHWPITKLMSHAFFFAGIRGPWPNLAVTIPLSLAVSILSARLFHMLVEKRFLNPKNAAIGNQINVTVAAAGILASSKNGVIQQNTVQGQRPARFVSLVHRAERLFSIIRRPRQVVSLAVRLTHSRTTTRSNKDGKLSEFCSWS
jgi:peptidoglycan/LPS O-acetylase OafA/YrhL